MGDVSQRDRQPSARYVERLAEDIADKLMYSLTDWGYCVEDARATQVKQLIMWTVIGAAKEARAENEKHDRRPPLPGTPSGRGGEQGPSEAPDDAAGGTD